MRDHLGERIDRKAAQVGEGIGYGLFNVGWWLTKKLFSPVTYLLSEEYNNTRTSPELTPNLKMLYEHTHIVGGSGSGKTQLLQGMVLRDLDPIARGWQTTIVIDSQGDMIDKILSLKKLQEPELAQRLVVIDPRSVTMPPCLNLFDF